MNSGVLPATLQIPKPWCNMRAKNLLSDLKNAGVTAPFHYVPQQLNRMTNAEQVCHHCYCSVQDQAWSYFARLEWKIQHVPAHKA